MKIHDSWRGKPCRKQELFLSSNGLKAGSMDIDIDIMISNLDSQSQFVCLLVCLFRVGIPVCSAKRPPNEQNEGCKSWAHVFQLQNQTEISWRTSRNDVLFEPTGSLTFHRIF